MLCGPTVTSDSSAHQKLPQMPQKCILCGTNDSPGEHKLKTNTNRRKSLGGALQPLGGASQVSICKSPSSAPDPPQEGKAAEEFPAVPRAARRAPAGIWALAGKKEEAELSPPPSIRRCCGYNSLECGTSTQPELLHWARNAHKF